MMKLDKTFKQELIASLRYLMSDATSAGILLPGRLRQRFKQVNDYAFSETFVLHYVEDAQKVLLHIVPVRGTDSFKASC